MDLSQVNLTSEMKDAIERCRRSRGLTVDQWAQIQYLASQRKISDKIISTQSSPVLVEETKACTKSHTVGRQQEQDSSNNENVREQSSGVLEKFRRSVTRIEHRQDLSKSEKVSRIIHLTCAICAGVAIQPIPFADIFVLTSIQAYFATRIAAIHGVPVSRAAAKDWVKETIGIIGLGWIAQQIAIGVWKVVTFGLGGFLTIPLVYGLTYGIMRIADAYFSAKSKNEKISEDRIRQIWKNARNDRKRY